MIYAAAGFCRSRGSAVLPVPPRHDSIVIAVEPIGRITFELSEAGAAQQHGGDTLNADVDFVHGGQVAAPDSNFLYCGFLAEVSQVAVLRMKRGREEAKSKHEFQSVHAPDVGGVRGFVEALGVVSRGAR